MRKPLTFVWLLGCLVLSAFSHSQTLNKDNIATAEQLIERMEALMWGGTNQGEASMTIETPHWQRTLTMQVWMDRPERTFIRILSPKKEKGIGSLRINDEMWNYIPNIDRVIKIPPSMMLQPWMGSDFSNDDLVKESSLIKDYSHRIISKDEDESGLIVHIEAIAKPDAPVVWGKIELWLYSDSFIPIRQVYYDERNEAKKALQFEDVKELGGRRIPTRWVMTPLDKDNQRTIITLHSMQFEIDIDRQIFTQLNLRDSF